MLLLGKRKRPARIADTLGLRRSTVTFDLHNLMWVLGIPSEEELLRLAVVMEQSASAFPQGT
jgi:DNA-binding CsgD family transcriptional regulator